ncbi:hypothetical protein B9Z47_02635 [Limnohabitans sp. 2KL-1]|uniref:CHASE2 domain-containing protein n=1 Tax=Limnohabitans sp. 2KL-1 TaxID=1100699 RepID=UPI000D39D424|nr:adenylate/guanylate cyclase domain-containing protein [Limnohabitans sp. 2KL-1]PUE50664.1 hypothetical protein B9Z47_02635 [Limnohabitans sp. 2KL-1]
MLQWRHQPNGLFSPFEHAIKDAIRRSIVDTRSETRMVVIDIDENSLNMVGPWPWPRSQMAQLIEDLVTEHGVRMIGLDVVFPAPADPVGDMRLQALAQFAPVVMAQVFDMNQREQAIVSGVPIGTTPPIPGNWPQAQGHLANHAGLSQARCAGNISSIIDTDGAVRRLNTVVTWGQAPQLSLGLAMLACDTQTAASLPRLLHSLVASGQDQHWEVPYSKHLDAYTVIPASQILLQQVNKERLRGKWVLIGSSALGLNDTVSIPLASSVPGVMVHAQALSTWLDQVEQGPDSTHPSARAIAVLWTLSTLALLAWAMARWRAWLLLPIGAALTLTWLGLASVLITWQQSFSVSAPILAYLAVLLMIPLAWWLTQKDRKQLLSTFATYVAPSVLDKMLQQGLDKPLTPRHTRITVLSADMQNYSGLTASGSLQETADLTRGFLQCITEPLLTHQGTLDKYTGDGLVAFWGAPLDTPQPENQALQAALEMVDAVHAWNLQRMAQGLPAARLRIGIESGQALVGDLGTPFRSTYTAVGTCINSASKIQAAAKHHPHDILVGEDAAVHMTDVKLVKVADLQWGATVRPKAVYAPINALQSNPEGGDAPMPGTPAAPVATTSSARLASP